MRPIKEETLHSSSTIMIRESTKTAAEITKIPIIREEGKTRPSAHSLPLLKKAEVETAMRIDTATRDLLRMLLTEMGKQ